MRKRARLVQRITVEDDILDRLRDLLKQATTERSHYYVAKCCRDAIAEIENLRREIESCPNED